MTLDLKSKTKKELKEMIDRFSVSDAEPEVKSYAIRKIESELNNRSRILSETSSVVAGEIDYSPTDFE